MFQDSISADHTCKPWSSRNQRSASAIRARCQTAPAVVRVDGEAIDPAFAAVVRQQCNGNEIRAVPQADHVLAAPGHLLGKGGSGITADRPDMQSGPLPKSRQWRDSRRRLSSHSVISGWEEDGRKPSSDLGFRR